MKPGISSERAVILAPTGRDALLIAETLAGDAMEQAICADAGVGLHLEAVKPGVEYKLTVTPKTQHVRATISVTPEIEGRATKVLTAHVRVS